MNCFLFQKYLEIHLFWTIAEICFMGAFVVTFCLVRIVPHFVSYISYMTTKFVLSLGLLYFYYRTLFVFFRISPVLGPMLISIKRMVSTYNYVIIGTTFYLWPLRVKLSIFKITGTKPWIQFMQVGKSEVKFSLKKSKDIGPPSV